MGQLDNTPNNPKAEDKAAREVLRSITQDLQALHDDLSTQLSQDIARLQGTKHRLLNDLEALEEEYQSLQTEYEALKAQHQVELSRQQLAQQQLWAKRLAQAMATHLQNSLAETIYNGASANGTGSSGSLQNAYQLLSALDASLNETLHCIEKELDSYRKNLTIKIDDMRSKEQQGEALLDALVNHISNQLQHQKSFTQSMTAAIYGNGNGTLPPPNGYTQTPAAPGQSGLAHYSPASPHEQVVTASASSPSLPFNPAPSSQSASPVAPLQGGQRFTNQVSAFQKGLLFIILSTLALSFHNVMVGLIGYGGSIFGQIPVEAIFPLNIPNSLMLLWLRMLVVLPLMLLVAGKIYPNVWKDIRHFLAIADKRPLFQVIASGCFLFTSQVLIYKAISEVGPGVAVTLLFMYPLITVPLAWMLFGERPTPLRAVVMFAIAVGIVFTTLPRISSDLNGGIVSPWGILAALLSSAAFALYLISMQLSFRRLHPVPVSLVQFTTIFVLSSLILIGGSFFGLETGEPSSYSGLYLAGLLLGGLTLFGYLFNNFGVRLMGAAQASIVASSGPVLTAILAYLITPGEKSMLQFIQWIGVILVTLGVLALSFEKLRQKPQAKPKKLSN